MNQRFNLWDHMDYVRLRIVRAVLFYAGASVVGYLLTPLLLSFMTDHMISHLVFLSPAEAFFTRLKLAFALGLVVGLPFILYQVWGLIEPAVHPRQRKIVWLLIPGACLFFWGGIAFSFFAVLPVALDFFLGFGAGLSAEISFANYIAFVIGFVLPFGLIFQLPMLVVLLTRIGILRPRQIVAHRKYVVLIAFIVGAVLTPPDVITQFMLALPLLLLFELSLLLARWVEPKETLPAKGKEH